MMVAAHPWDTLGGQSAGMLGALITRPGHAPFLADGVPQPTVIAADIVELGTAMSSYAWTNGAR
jgi:2-haloacid dehalogenase